MTATTIGRGRRRTKAKARRRTTTQARRGTTTTARRATTTKVTTTPRTAAARVAVSAPLANWLGIVVLTLTLFGLVMVLSASSVTSTYQLDGSPYYQFKRQLMWAGLGAVSFVVTSRVDYRRLRPLAGVGLAIAVALLVLVLVPGVGRNINGSSRWLALGPLVFQPAEVAKVAMIVWIADLLARRERLIRKPELTIRPVLVVLALLSALLLLQPKLGTPLVLAAVAFTMLFVAGARVDHLAGWTTLGVAAAAILAYSADYRRQRIFAFLDPWADPQGFGMQTIQSQVGIASGGLLGVGLGAGSAKWGFLPYAHSDFIFAIVAEEVGLIGAATLVVAFVVLAWLGVRIAIGAGDTFGRLLATGLTSWILIQAFLNIGMAIGQLPITGEPLPFVSAGGSSLLMALTAAGVLCSVARHQGADRSAGSTG